MDKTEVPEPNYSVLESIGFSPLAAASYGSLNSVGDATVSELASRLHAARTNLYQLLKRLHAWGFVGNNEDLDNVICYHAIKLEVALASYAEYQRQQVADLLIYQRIMKMPIDYWREHSQNT